MNINGIPALKKRNKLPKTVTAFVISLTEELLKTNQYIFKYKSTFSHICFKKDVKHGQNNDQFTTST